MTVELGHYALVLAFAVALVQTILPLAGWRLRDSGLLATASPAALAQAALVIASFAVLTWAFLVSDFSVSNVVENSHSLKPTLYKLTGVWGNHEGSMLLWVVILALFGAGVAAFGREIAPELRALALAVQGSLSAAFIAFILFTSNPFLRVSPAPFEGRDLNPLLQDPGLAIHPPLLYLGYVGFSVAFSFAAAALITGRIDAAWARTVRPWVLAAWVALTFGIAMGSYWAYYELGWGGFWFWDPVENASLMPWLTGTALLHSVIVMERRDALKTWTLLLAVVTFALSLMGTFLVRSGILTSVHAFAVDPERGLFILLILLAFIGGSLALYALRAGRLTGGGLFAPVSREGALVLNNLFLSVACLTVLIGTLYPLLLEATTGDKISVGPPYFNMTFMPLTLPLLLGMPLGQQLAWKRGDLLGAAQRLVASAALALVVLLVVLSMTAGGPVVAVIGIALGLFAVFAALDDLRIRAMRGGASGAWRRFVGLPRTTHAAALAHAGVGLMVIGIAATAFERERIATLGPGDTVEVGRYTLRLEAIGARPGPNYNALVARFAVSRDGRPVAIMEPAKRTYAARTMSTSEVARHTRGLGQLYLAIGEVSGAQKVDLRAYWKPYVLLIWLGPGLMGIAGLLSLSDRRLRIGAPQRARIAPAAAV